MAVIAVDCGGTHLTVAWRERAAGPGPTVTVPTPATVGAIPGDIVACIAGLPSALAVGVGVAGLVDHAAGRVDWMPHRPGSAAIAEVVGARSGLPVVVDNDANTAALAEATAGAGAGYRLVLVVTVGTGIGGGLVVDGSIERGRGHLGEIGHMSMDPDGERCPCGAIGCWEVAASGRALDSGAAGLGLADGAALMAAAAGGDAAAGRVVGEVAAAFGRGLGNLVAILDPDVIVVGGGVVAAGEAFLSPARRTLAAAVSGGSHRRPTPVVAARFGPAAGIVGAALMAGAPL